MMLSLQWFLSILMFFLSIFYLAYIYMTRNFDFWKKLGVPYSKPMPFFGNLYDIALFRVSAAAGMKRLYDQFDAPFVGIFVFDKPVLLLKSPKLIHDISVKHFSQFIDKSTASPDHNKVNSSLLFFQSSPEWKESRSKLSPLFSPAKLKVMLPIVCTQSGKLMDYLRKTSAVDIIDVTHRINAETVMACFFGIKTDCLEDDNSEILKTTRGIFGFNIRNAVVQSLYFFKAGFINFLRIDFLKPWIVDSIGSIVLESLKNRANIPGRKTYDVVDVVKKMHSGKFEDHNKLNSEDIEEIIGTALSFIIAGVETIASAISYLLYELALHEDIQTRLRQEIQDVIKNESEITYEAIQTLKFLDSCVMETLRKYPFASHTCRKSSTDYTFTGTNVTIPKGTCVYLPLYALSMDESRFTDPHKFIPDRFMDFHKKEGEIHFLPFGAGPRVCLGERFALMTVKATVIHSLLNFKVQKCPSTPETVEFELKCFVMKPKEDIKLEFIPLNGN